MDINSLYAPMDLSHQVIKYGQQVEKTPANFTSANNSFASLMQNPMLFAAGGGNVTDPSQTQASGGTAYLGERAGIASTDLQTKASFADLLANAGSNVGSLMANLLRLQTQQQQSQNTATGGLTGIL